MPTYSVIKAATELQEMLEALSAKHAHIFKQLACVGTEWHFNSAEVPDFVGLWEAGVKSVKSYLRRVVDQQILTFFDMSILLCKIEAISNSRPMLRLTDDISDLDPLTPAHFLIQRQLFAVLEADYRHEKLPLGKRWQLFMSQMAQYFWDRWSKGYLTSLQLRDKWQRPQQLSPQELGDA